MRVHNEHSHLLLLSTIRKPLQRRFPEPSAARPANRGASLGSRWMISSAKASHRYYWLEVRWPVKIDSSKAAPAMISKTGTREISTL